MYGFDWANEAVWRLESQPPAPEPSLLDRELVERTLLLHWQEHCIECAPPDCYAVCPLFVERADHKCARFVYGIVPNAAFPGLLDVGADVRFRRWGKLESQVGGTAVTPRAHRRLATVDRAATAAAGGVARLAARVDPRRRVSGAYAVLRDRLLARAPRSDALAFDDFVLECHAPDDEPFRLVLEWSPHDRPVLRHVFDIRPGRNLHKLPAGRFGSLDGIAGGRLLVYPEGDVERRLVFSWLDFVRYRDPVAASGTREPAPLVKAVAWDLDGTLWDGTLLEDGPEGCRLREDAAALVRALDDRGILQTVASKNDHDEAWRVVERTGLADYFLYPQIGWGRKSDAIRRAADLLDIGVDTFAFVDDSSFERAEVAETLPMVRVYDSRSLEGLLSRPELDVPVTDAARGRRLQYRTRSERHDAALAFEGDYLDFLRSCRIELSVLEPREPGRLERCLELVQRSNQLNLSKRAYSREQFEELLATPGVLGVALAAEDRFGDYGIIGFVAVDERGETPAVRDLVLSCRIAQKHVEHAFFGWLAERETARGAASLRAELVHTSRNGPLQRVFEELPFSVARRDGERTLFELDLPAPIGDDVVTVRDLVAV
jgi:FkbH-like protein